MAMKETTGLADVYGIYRCSRAYSLKLGRAENGLVACRNEGTNGLGQSSHRFCRMCPKREGCAKKAVLRSGMYSIDLPHPTLSLPIPTASVHFPVTLRSIRCSSHSHLPSLPAAM